MVIIVVVGDPPPPPQVPRLGTVLWSQECFKSSQIGRKDDNSVHSIFKAKHSGLRSSYAALAGGGRNIHNDDTHKTPIWPPYSRRLKTTPTTIMTITTTMTAQVRSASAAWPKHEAIAYRTDHVTWRLVRRHDITQHINIEEVTLQTQTSTATLHLQSGKG